MRHCGVRSESEWSHRVVAKTVRARLVPLLDYRECCLERIGWWFDGEIGIRGVVELCGLAVWRLWGTGKSSSQRLKNRPTQSRGGPMKRSSFYCKVDLMIYNYFLLIYADGW